MSDHRDDAEKQMTVQEWLTLGLLCKDEAAKYPTSHDTHKVYRKLAAKCFVRETALLSGRVMP